LGRVVPGVWEVVRVVCRVAATLLVGGVMGTASSSEAESEEWPGRLVLLEAVEAMECGLRV
jgi:hypothetical protein